MKRHYPTYLWSLLGMLCMQSAEARPDIQLVLTTLVAPQCTAPAQPDLVAAPGDCIIYRIHVKNRGSLTAYHVQVSGRVPEQTQLLHNLWLQSPPTPGALRTLPATPYQVQAVLDQVRPDGEYVVDYHVRVR